MIIHDFLITLSKFIKSHHSEFYYLNNPISITYCQEDFHLYEHYKFERKLDRGMDFMIIFKEQSICISYIVPNPVISIDVNPSLILDYDTDITENILRCGRVILDKADDKLIKINDILKCGIKK